MDARVHVRSYRTRDLQHPGFGLYKQRLIEAPFGNEMAAARYLKPVIPGLGHAPVSLTSVAAVDEADLSLMISGASDVVITDPAGRRIVVEPTSGQYESNIDEIFMVRGWREDDDQETGPGGYSGQDLIHLPNALEGVYLIRVVGQDSDVGITVNATDGDGLRAAAGVLDTTAAGLNSVYRLTYAAGTGFVQMEHLAITDVGETTWPSAPLRVLQNPATDLIRFVVPAIQGPDELVIYDASGRRIDTVRLDAGRESDVRVVTWNASRLRCPPGVYFARLRQTGPAQVVRFVLLR